MDVLVNGWRRSFPMDTGAMMTIPPHDIVSSQKKLTPAKWSLLTAMGALMYFYRETVTTFHISGITPRQPALIKM